MKNFMKLGSLDLNDERISQVMLPFIRLIDPLSKVKPEEIVYTSLKGGGSQANLYRFEFNERHYVLRLLPPQAERPIRMHQINLAKQAGKIGVGPEIYFVNLRMNGMVMEFISGQTSERKDFEKPDHIVKFAKFLLKLHQSPERFPLACTPFQRFNDFMLKGEQKKIVYPSRFAELKILMRELEETFRLFPIPLVPSHLDLHPLNILSTESQFFLVDWVNGGLSDPFFDLATFTIFHDFNHSQTTTFLSSYFNHVPTQHEWNRFTVTQPIRLFVVAAALLTLSTDMPPSYEEALQSSELPPIEDLGKEGLNWSFWQYGLTMYKAGLALIDQDNFKVALKELQKEAQHVSFNLIKESLP
jgi:thiamine kinase-like enzyme